MLVGVDILMPYTGNVNTGTMYWKPLQGEKIIYQNKVDLVLASFIVRVANPCSRQYLRHFSAVFCELLRPSRSFAYRYFALCSFWKT